MHIQINIYYSLVLDDSSCHKVKNIEKSKREIYLELTVVMTTNKNRYNEPPTSCLTLVAVEERLSSGSAIKSYMSLLPQIVAYFLYRRIYKVLRHR